MAYTAPHTITPGEPVTVATMNNEWGGNVSFLANPPACRVYHNANQSIANSSRTALAFNSERYDTNAMHSTVTNNSRITFNVAGLYVVTGCVEMTASAGGSFRQVDVRLNGTTTIVWQLDGPNAVATKIALSTVYKFAAADYIELMMDQNSGGALNALAVGNYTPEFSATWIGLG